MNKTICLLLLAISGCSDDGGAVDAADPSSFCRAASTTQCHAMYTCLTAAERDAENLPATEAECQRKFESACESALDRCNDSTTHEYASTAAATCLSQMNDATCSDAAEPFLDQPACEKVCATTAGSIQLRWQFSPSTYTCAGLGVETVEVITTGGGKTYNDLFDCFAYGGTTAAVPVGGYQVKIKLYNASNQQLWESPAVTATLDKDLVDVGTIQIPVGT